ncbi:MAG TPA: ectonucleotide pyrophosphatase/phosphodiesterase [Vicinamibacterales bacterium]
MTRLTFRAMCLALAVVSLVLTADAREADRHVVMISIDGLRPVSYTAPGPARIPTLRALAARGAWASGVIGVLPTVTYPSHTTLITGVQPARHGIPMNTYVDPEARSAGAWYWYARDIKVTTLPGAVRARGLTAASVSWPVTVGMDLDYNVPEFNRSQHPEALNALRAFSFPPRLIDGYEAAHGPLAWPFSDAERTGLAAWLVRTFKPSLTLLHIFDTDSASHAEGPDSPQALEALERADGHVATMIKAVEDAGLADRTDIVIVSDHGFLPLEKQLHPNAIFKREGLIETNENGTITGWQAYYKGNGGSGFVYLRNRDDEALKRRVRELLDALAADPANGIEKVWDEQDLAQIGATPDAVFALTMKPGFYSGGGHRELLTSLGSRGGHGFDPNRTELHASLIMAGPSVTRKGDLGIVRMSQIAPTIARWFGVQLDPEADAPLW